MARLARRPVARRRLKQVTNAQGWPVFGNIARVRHDGRPERVFLQEELFGPEDYRPIVASHDSLVRHPLCTAQTSRDHAKARGEGVVRFVLLGTS